MIKKLWLGWRLRCPNCERGHISDGIFSIRETCPVCNVRFERKAGESAGASIIWISVLPLVALIMFFAMYFALPNAPTWLISLIPLLFVVGFGVGFYRNVRGLWIAIVYLTGGVYADEDATPEGYVRKS